MIFGLPTKVGSGYFDEAIERKREALFSVFCGTTQPHFYNLRDSCARYYSLVYVCSTIFQHIPIPFLGLCMVH